MTATQTEPVYLDLGETKTYARRYALWFAGRGDHDDPRMGTLRIRQDRRGGGADVTQYGVEFDTDPAPVGFVRFILRNDEPPPPGERREFYAVSVGEDYAGCSCTGETTRSAGTGRCKHIAALKELLMKGVTF